MQPGSDPVEPAGSAVSADYGKLDAPLASVLSGLADVEAPELSVFVHLTRLPGGQERDRLLGMGLSQVSRRATVLTATLSALQVSALSRDELVAQVRLSQHLGPSRAEGRRLADPHGGGSGLIR